MISISVVVMRDVITISVVVMRDVITLINVAVIHDVINISVTTGCVIVISLPSSVTHVSSCPHDGYTDELSNQ